jgi:hypothetical protein
MRRKEWCDNEKKKGNEKKRKVDKSSKLSAQQNPSKVIG